MSGYTSALVNLMLATSLPPFVENPNPEVYLSDNYTVIDFETTNFDNGAALDPRNRLLLACGVVGKDHPHARHYPNGFVLWGGEFDQRDLLGIIRDSEFVVAHNTKFELQWLARCGLDLRTVLPFDTLLAEYVQAGNRRRDLSLDATAGRRGFGTKAHAVHSLIQAGGLVEEIPAKWLEEYCKRDVELTEKVFLQQREELRREGLLPVAYCRNLVTPALADIETKGMCLDKDRVLKAYSERMEGFRDLRGRFDRLTGGINHRSAKQLRKLLYGAKSDGGLGFGEAADHKGRPLRTSGGQPRTDKGVLGLLVAERDDQREFLDAALALAKEKKPVENLEKMQKVLAAGNNIVYARYNQAVTQTHRLSSSGRGGGFQFHNFDRAFKPLFRSRHSGWLVVEGDAPQLEFRVAAELGRDPQALADIREGADIHAFTAKILGTSRQNAKPHTFKPLYGGMSGTPREKKYYEEFRKKYKDIYATQEGWTYAVLKDKALTLPWGIKFYWPDTSVTQSGYITNTPSIFNYPIQSFATADIIPLTLVLVWHRMAAMEGFLVNTIHDSIIAEIPPSELDIYTRILVDSFTKDIYGIVEKLYGIKLGVPLGVGVKSAEHWGEGKETKFDSGCNAAP